MPEITLTCVGDENDCNAYTDGAGYVTGGGEAAGYLVAGEPSSFFLLRFPVGDAPLKWATITSAVLRLHAPLISWFGTTQFDSTACNFQLAACRVAGAPAFDHSDAQAAAFMDALTTPIDWDDVAAEAAGDHITAPDVATAVQALVQHAVYANGDAIVLAVGDWAGRSVLVTQPSPVDSLLDRAYSGGVAGEAWDGAYPELVITYTPGEEPPPEPPGEEPTPVPGDHRMRSIEVETTVGPDLDKLLGWLTEAEGLVDAHLYGTG